MALGIVDAAQTAAKPAPDLIRVLGHNFPRQGWYKDACNLVKNAGLAPRENPASWISKASKGLSLGFASE